MTSENLSSQPSTLAAGFPCPKCRAPIQFSLQVLTRARTIHCPACGLALEIDAQQSAAALAALRKYNAEIETIQRDQ